MAPETEGECGVVTDELPAHAETAIIGAGVAGLTAALRLAQAGREVVVLEGSEPWRGGSGVNPGTLALKNRSQRFWPSY
jgi:glycine/D-amino acid oxidase-like deaminating enzyme